MPISPIDFISIAPKSQEASQIQAGQGDRQAQANAMVGTQFQQHVERNSRQTIQKSNADNDEYRYDAREKGNNSYQNRKKKKDSRKNGGEKDEKQIKLSNFDIRF